MNDDKKPGEQETEELLQLLMPNPRPARNERRFRFGVGLLLLAPFCLVVAGFPRPKVELIDRIMWVGFALTLLFLGGWQIDKSNKEGNGPDDKNSSLPDDESTQTLPRKNLRRVK